MLEQLEVLERGRIEDNVDRLLDKYSIQTKEKNKQKISEKINEQEDNSKAR